MTREEKIELVQQCLDKIEGRISDLCFKHDGCRLLQTLVKNGNKAQRIQLIDQIKGNLSNLMTNKYSHYLAAKVFKYVCDDKQRSECLQHITEKINTLIIHMVSCPACLLFSSHLRS